MRRVQLQFDDEQADYLAARAAREGGSVAELVRGIIARERASDDRQRRIEIALAALEKPAYHSGLTDVAERHDDYLAADMDEEVERWRR